jgi:urea transport system permease protein
MATSSGTRTSPGRGIRWSEGLLPVVALALAFAVVVASLRGDFYTLMILRDALVFGLFALALDFLWGRTGQLSFGHATFFGLGAYAVAITTTSLGIANATLLGLLIGVLVSGAVALVFGYFLIFAGVRGPYFTIMTLALTVIAYHIAIAWVPVTRGDSGITGVQPLSVSIGPWEYIVVHPQVGLWVALAILLIVLLTMWLVVRGRYGRLLKAIEDNELRASTLGYNTPLHLVGVFTISGMIAGLAGGLYATFSGYVAPDLIGLLLSTKVIIWVAIGGRGTLLGPIIGAVVVLQLEREISSIDTSLWPLFMGAFFIAMVFLFPDGFVGLAQRGWQFIHTQLSSNTKKDTSGARAG